MRAGDVAALDALIADDLDFVGPGGERISKQEDLAAHRAGPVRFDAITQRRRDTHVRDDDGTTVVTADVVVAVDGGPPAQVTLVWTRHWRLRDGRWQVFRGSVTAADGVPS